jgi:Na+/H+-translocating membrane pyrophosphatase
MPHSRLAVNRCGSPEKKEKPINYMTIVDLTGERSLGHYTATQILVVVAIVFVGLTLVGYALLCRSSSWLGQIVTFVAQLLTGESAQNDVQTMKSSVGGRRRIF